LFVEDAELFFSKANASKAILASSAIKEECTVTALFAELAVKKFIACDAIGAFVTPFRILNKYTVDAACCS
jgi:hypothetical protein